MSRFVTMVIRLAFYVRKSRGGGRKNDAIQKKHGDMQFSFVYFEEKVSNNLLQENYNAVMSGYVSIIIRKQLFCYFFQ